MVAVTLVVMDWSTGERGRSPRDSEPATLHAAPMTPAWAAVSVDQREIQWGRRSAMAPRLVVAAECDSVNTGTIRPIPGTNMGSVFDSHVMHVWDSCDMN
jgi:hypothetical protein